MTEDEEFEALEKKLSKSGSLKVVPDYMHEAVLAAQRFIEANQADLGIFTLRKAFEMGYRAACLRAMRGDSSSKVCGND